MGSAGRRTETGLVQYWQYLPGCRDGLFANAHKPLSRNCRGCCWTLRIGRHFQTRESLIGSMNRHYERSEAVARQQSLWFGDCFIAIVVFGEQAPTAASIEILEANGRNRCVVLKNCCRGLGAQPFDTATHDGNDKGRKCGPCRWCFPDDYFFAVRRSRFNNRRASSPNSSVCVGCGKMAFATWVSVISPATIITPMPIRVSVWSAR